MARNVYSTRFIGGKGASSYSYTVPDGYVALFSCMDVHIGSTTAGGNLVTSILSGLILGYQTYLPIAPVDLTYRGKIVLYQGEELVVFSDSSDDFDCQFSGDLLTLP